MKGINALTGPETERADSPAAVWHKDGTHTTIRTVSGLKTTSSRQLLCTIDYVTSRGQTNISMRDILMSPQRRPMTHALVLLLAIRHSGNFRIFDTSVIADTSNIVDASMLLSYDRNSTTAFRRIIRETSQLFCCLFLISDWRQRCLSFYCSHGSWLQVHNQVKRRNVASVAKRHNHNAAVYSTKHAAHRLEVLFRTVAVRGPQKSCKMLLDQL